MASFYLKMVVGLLESYISSVNRALGSLIRLVFLLIGSVCHQGTATFMLPDFLSSIYIRADIIKYLF